MEAAPASERGGAESSAKAQRTSATAESALPRIDISGFRSSDPAERARVARLWDEAMRSVGLVTVVGHGVSDALCDELHASATEFFEASHEQKMRSCLHQGYGPGGYVPQGVEAVARSRPEGAGAPPDLVENLVFSHEGDPSREAVMPSTPPALQPAVARYWRELRELLRTIMRLSAAALDLAPTHFDAPFEKAKCNLRLAYYAGMGADGARDAGASGAMRYGAHTDYTGFTLLRQDVAADGLQAQLRDGSWVGVPPERGSFVINAGDLIQVWTNDRWRSPPHRVLAPTAAAPSRLSLVFFTGPADETLVEALPGCYGDGVPKRYEPVTSGEHLRRKIRASNA